MGSSKPGSWRDMEHSRGKRMIIKTETPQEQLKRISKELEAVGFERRAYTDDFSKHGIEEWDRLWARQLELLKQYDKLKEKIDAQSTPTTVPAQA